MEEWSNVLYFLDDLTFCLHCQYQGLFEKIREETISR